MAYTTINKSGDYFNTKLWTGTGSNGNAISGVGFAPDWVWVKNRSGTYDHVLFDRVRGDNKHVESNNNSAEENEANTLAFGSDGYSVGTNTLNNNNDNIVSWNWKANGAGSANTDGDINSTVSVNTTAGFSIVKFAGNGTAGNTVGHGLGVVPKFMIVKEMTNASSWITYHHSLGNTRGINLNETGAGITSNNYWNSTSPTSTVFSTGAWTNEGSSRDYIVYCFAEKTGYSKFGSYTGNGNADGIFVYTGFKPALVICKRTDGGTQNWCIMDNKRGYNSDVQQLHPNANNVESLGSGDTLDLLSNGFKMRATDGDKNGSGETYIYMAFAEAPLVGSNNIPCTAR